jgi:hypothetical protein
LSGTGPAERSSSSILIPSEEVVFSLYEAPSPVVIRQLNERVNIPVSRIVEAIVVAERSVPC